MKKLYKFQWNCGRMGDLDGVFVAEEKDVKNIIGKKVYFGEVLGKHSEIYGDIGKDDIEEVDVDAAFISKFEEILPYGVGHNPLDYYDPEEISQ